MDGAVIPTQCEGKIQMANLAGVLKELKHERSQLDHAIEVIGKLVTRNGTDVKVSGLRPKRTLSAAARRKIAAAQRARWVKVRQRQQKKAA
jgi:hypothetical protein